MRNNMITKKLIKFALLFFLIGLTACDNKLNPGFDPDDYEPIVPPEPVRTMDAMASGERVVLSGASLTDIVLKWTPTEKHGNTVYRYEVLIDTIGGDFTKPVETIFSDNNGYGAAALAATLGADLILLSDVSGILDGKGQRIAEMTAEKAEQLIEQGIITDGMIVKVNAALDAARALGRPVDIASWRHAEQLPALFNGTPIGTRILA